MYSWKKPPPSIQNSKHSISSVNLSSLEKDSLIDTLESTLSKFKEKANDTQSQVKQEPRQVEEEEELEKKEEQEEEKEEEEEEQQQQSVSEEPIKKEDANVPADCDNDESDSDSDNEAESSDSDEESEASTYVHNNEEAKEREVEDRSNFHAKKDVCLSPREKDLRSMSTEEKVNIWLPQAQTKGRDIQISIDESQKLALLAKLNEIDSDNVAIEATDGSLRDTSAELSSSIPVSEVNNNPIDRKNDLMAELFGEKAFIARRKNTFTITSKPLKTSLRTSPSGPTKSVKFLEDSQF